MSDRPSSFAHIIQILRQQNAANKTDEDDDETQSDDTDDKDDDDQDKRKKTKKKSSDIKDHEGDETRDRDIGPGDEDEDQAARVAADIIRCGQMRRGEVEIPVRAPPAPRQSPLTPSEVKATAEAILAAGRRRRGELP